MRLHLSTWQEVETYLQTSRAILIPIGSTEQHGPTGLIGTDALCPEIIGGLAAESGLLMAPTFNIGVAQHHMEFPGSMTLRPSTFIANMVDWVDSLAKHGFTHFYWLNGHGGNIATINAGFAEIYASRSLDTGNGGRPAVRCKLRNWWEGKETYAKCKALYGNAHGAHATPSEVAVTQYAYPDHIKTAPLSPEIAPNGGFTDARDYRNRFPDGRIGSNPGLATPEDGEVLAKLAAKEVTEDFDRFANGH